MKADVFPVVSIPRKCKLNILGPLLGFFHQTYFLANFRFFRNKSLVLRGSKPSGLL